MLVVGRPYRLSAHSALVSCMVIASTLLTIYGRCMITGDGGHAMKIKGGGAIDRPKSFTLLSLNLTVATYTSLLETQRSYDLALN